MLLQIDVGKNQNLSEELGKGYEQSMGGKFKRLLNKHKDVLHHS